MQILKKITVHSASIAIAMLLFLVIVFRIVSGGLADVGPIMISMFVLVAIGFNRSKMLKGYVFPAVIFSGVTLAMYYPQYFQYVGSVKLTVLIVPLIQVIMFGMGTSMSIRDFGEIFKSPRGVLIGVSAQLTLMPIMGFILATSSGLPPEIAAGIVLIGCSPSGVASNVMAYLAKANLALSITITTISTLCAPFSTPLLMKLLAGEFISIDVLSMMWSIIQMIIFPIGTGLLFNRLFGNRFTWLNKLLPVLSMTAIGVVIVIITAAGRDSLIDIGIKLVSLVIVHNLFGYFLGYYYAKVFRLQEQDARTVAIEVGMQNAGLASGIADTLGKIATMGLAPAVFGPLMNITGSILASYWHNRIPEVRTYKKESLVKSDAR